MPTFAPKHYALTGALLVAIGMQLAGAAHGWQDVLTPGFLGGLIVQVGTTIVAIFTDAPRQPWNGMDRRHDEHIGV